MNQRQRESGMIIRPVWPHLVAKKQQELRDAFAKKAQVWTVRIEEKKAV